MQASQKTPYAATTPLISFAFCIAAQTRGSIPAHAGNTHIERQLILRRKRCVFARPASASRRCRDTRAATRSHQPHFGAAKTCPHVTRETPTSHTYRSCPSADPRVWVVGSSNLEGGVIGIFPYIARSPDGLDGGLIRGHRPSYRRPSFRRPASRDTPPTWRGNG
jgi:hypothetical protein